MRDLKGALGVALVFVASAGVAAGISSVRQRDQSRTEVADEYSPEAYAKRTRWLVDSSQHVATLLSRARAADTTIALVLRGLDIERCEDLGRQIRQVVGTHAPFYRTELWANENDTAQLKAFLRVERIEGLAVRVASLSALGSDTLRAFITPAALLVVDSSGRYLGVAHPGRFANSRPMSFSDELKKLGANRGSFGVR